jgi:TPR repeat protein
LPIDPSTAFVSYSREDLEFVRRLATDLKAKGAKVWMDKLDIRPGKRWEVEVETALNSCSRMLVILSPASVSSSNVLAEAAYAIDEGQEVIPVLYRECKIPFRLRPFQYADFRTNYEVGLDELLTSLSTKNEATASATAEEARLEAESIQAVADTDEKARLAQQEHERQAAAEKARQEEPEWQRVAEQPRSEEEHRQAEADKARQQQLERERKAAQETARQEEFERQRVAAEQARLEEERKAVAETACRGQEERERRAVAEQPPLEQQEQKLPPGMNKTLADVYWKAVAGDCASMADLALAYYSGKGVSKSYKEAASWFSQAAEAGDRDSMFNLGVMFEDGEGMRKDPARAVSWYRKAAEAGDAQSMYNLGVMYEEGLGVANDMLEAIAWYRRAAALGNTSAKDNLKRLGETSR